MLDASLFADLVTELPAAVRLQRLVTTLRSHFACGAVALLQLQHAQLKPIAVHGLLRETKLYLLNQLNRDTANRTVAEAVSNTRTW